MFCTLHEFTLNIEECNLREVLQVKFGKSNDFNKMLSVHLELKQYFEGNDAIDEMHEDLNFLVRMADKCGKKLSFIRKSVFQTIMFEPG